MHAPVQTFWPEVALGSVPGSREGPAEAPGRPLFLPPATQPLSQCPWSHPRGCGSPAHGRGNQGHAAGAHLEPSSRPPAPPRRPGSRGRGPSVAGASHLLRWVQALPLDGRGHWGGRWRARRRGRSLCGAGLAGCRGSDPLGCSGAAAAAAAPAPLLAPALWRRARPSALKDSHRAPFKRQRERANHRAAGAPRPRRGPGRAAWPRAAAAATAAQDLTFHPGPAATAATAAAAAAGSGSARALSPAPRRPRGWCAPARPPRAPRTFSRGCGAQLAAEGREGAAAWGRGRDTAPLSPGSLLSWEGLFSLSFPLSLVSFPFS